MGSTTIIYVVAPITALRKRLRKEKIWELRKDHRTTINKKRRWALRKAALARVNFRHGVFGCLRREYRRDGL